MRFVSGKVFIVSALLSLPLSVQADGAADMAEHKKAAQSVIKAFATTLKGELVSAMKSGGPVNAIEVCNSKAPEIAGQLSEENDVILTRVSLKNRNPDIGKPTEWQVEVLNKFEERQAEGEAIADIAFAEITKPEDDEPKSFRLMKAIPTDGICLACHGETLAPDISKKLNELYPDDKATGYEAGQIRGAFVYVKDL